MTRRKCSNRVCATSFRRPRRLGFGEMMTLVSVIGTVITILVVLALVQVLYGIIRFSVISPIKTKGAKERLRHPEPHGIETVSGFSPSAELLAFYQQAPFLEDVEFYLLDRSKQPSIAWSIGGFSPLTVVDVRENRKVSGVNGIPIADDLDGGVYFVATDGRVMLSSRNVPGREVEVAPSVTVFANFEKTNNPQE